MGRAPTNRRCGTSHPKPSASKPPPWSRGLAWAWLDRPSGLWWGHHTAAGWLGQGAGCWAPRGQKCQPCGGLSWVRSPTLPAEQVQRPRGWGAGSARRAGQGRTPPAVAAALTVLKEQPERQAERSQRTAHWSRAEASPSSTRSPPTCCIRCRTPSHLGASTNWEMPRPLRPRPTALLRPPGARRGSVATWTRAPAHRPSQLLHRGQRGPSSPRTFASWPRSCSANATGIELSTFGGPWGRVA